MCYCVPWGLAETNINVFSEVSGRGYVAPPGAVTSLPASGMTVPEGDMIPLEAHEGSFSSIVHLDCDLQLVTLPWSSVVTRTLLHFWCLKSVANVLVWNVCETQSSKEAGKGALNLKDSENSSKQKSGDGHQWQQLEFKNMRPHFAVYFRLILKLSKTIYNSGNECLHLKVSYVWGSSWYDIAYQFLHFWSWLFEALGAKV